MVPEPMNSRSCTRPLWPVKMLRMLPLATSHKRTVCVQTMCVCGGGGVLMSEKAAAQCIQRLHSVNLCTLEGGTELFRQSHTLSSLPVASVRESGENWHVSTDSAWPFNCMGKMVQALC